MPSETVVLTNAFQFCSALSLVKYEGFKAQWDAMSVGAQNDKLLNASVSYLYRSGRFGTTNVYYDINGWSGSVLITGSGGSTVHVTMPWYAQSWARQLFTVTTIQKAVRQASAQWTGQAAVEYLQETRTHCLICQSFRCQTAL